MEDPSFCASAVGRLPCLQTRTCISDLLIGFAGHELDSFDIYDVRGDAWRAVLPAPDPEHGSPGARSVYGLVPFVSSRYPRSLALMYHGERGPSALGHAGAGEFWDDVWLIEAGAEGEPELSWKYVQG
jgi:hypothetical protein